MKKLIMYVFGDIATDARVQRAAEALSNRYNVIVLSLDKGKKPDSSIYQNIILPESKGPFKRYLTYFNSVRKAIAIIKKEKPDVFYAHDYYSALVVKKVLGKGFCDKIIYDAHELIIPENGSIDRRMRYFYNNEKCIVRHVDLLICANDERAEEMKKHYSLMNKPLVIRNISQLKSIDSPESELLINKLDNFFKDERTTIVYAGVVNRGRNVRALIEAVRSHSDKVKLLIIGGGDELKSLMEMVSLDNQLPVTFTGPIPYKCLGALLSRCDAGYLYYPNNKLNNILCASNKIYEYSSLHLPIISNENITIKKDLEKYKIGYCSDNIEEALIYVLQNMKQLKENCSLFNSENNWQIEKIKLINAVSNLV